MEDLKFKDVMHHYMDCKVYINHPHAAFNVDTLDADLYLCFVTGRVSIQHYKPILFPLSAMTDEQVQEIGLKSHPKEWDMNIECYYRPKTFLWLLRKHFNVFNLPEDQFIDATTLPVNPYSKP